MILDPTPRTFHLSAADRAGPGSGGVVGADAAAGFSFTVKRRSAALRPRCLAAPLPRCRRRGGAPARRLRSPLAGRGPRRARGHHCLFPCESLLNQQLLSAMSRKHFVLFCFLPSSSLKRERVKAKKKKTQQARSMELTISGGKTKVKKKKKTPLSRTRSKKTLPNRHNGAVRRALVHLPRRRGGPPYPGGDQGRARGRRRPQPRRGDAGRGLGRAQRRGAHPGAFHHHRALRAPERGPHGAEAVAAVPGKEWEEEERWKEEKKKRKFNASLARWFFLRRRRRPRLLLPSTLFSPIFARSSSPLTHSPSSLFPLCSPRQPTCRKRSKRPTLLESFSRRW